MRTVANPELSNTHATAFYPTATRLYPVKGESTSDYTILVVDYERSTRELIRLYLNTLGYHVLVAENGAEALETMMTHSFDLVFLDIMLPNLDGLATCTAIREYSEIPIVMLTALKHLDYAAQALQLGADGYITKPFALNTLKLRLQGLLHNRHGRL